MEREVYPQAAVGRYINAHFIAVHVQMDSTAKDAAAVRRWYADAHLLNQRYQVRSYPTFLFFTPDGILIHRGGGQQDTTRFLALAAYAMDSTQPYVTRLAQYRRGRAEIATLGTLARTAQALKDGALADSIAQIYLTRYLYSLPPATLYTKEQFDFIGTFLRSSHDPGFSLFTHSGDTVDRIMGQPGYAQQVVDRIIGQEEVKPVVWPGGQPAPATPDWAALTARIASKYTAPTAERVVLNAQFGYYRTTQDWPALTSVTVQMITHPSLFPERTPRALNDMIWDVLFQHSTDHAALEQGIAAMEGVLKAEPYDGNNLDSYANLLYKVGRTPEALRWEQRAALLRPGDKEIQKNYENMKAGRPTWPTS